MGSLDQLPYSLASLKDSLKGDVVTQTDADYPEAIARWSTIAEREAAAVIFPKNAEDVSMTLKHIVSHEVPFAIKGGGHSISGISSSDGGVVIDLNRHMNGARVDPEQKLAYVGGGAVWKEVDEAGMKHGLATTGGTVNRTGVGGLTLGGGFGWLTGQHGLALDNVVQATVVTADGSILTASSSSHPDLFFGIRGGGCNFGVITEFVFQLYPHRRTVCAGLITFPGKDLEKVVQVIDEKYAVRGDPKAGMIHVITTTADKRMPITMCAVFYDGSEEEGRAYYKPLHDLGPMADATKEVPYELLNTTLNPGLPHGFCHYFKGVQQVRPDINTIRPVFNDLVAQAQSGPLMKMSMLFEYYPTEKIMENSHLDTAFQRSTLTNVMFTSMWKENTPENLKFARTHGHDFTKRLEQRPEGKEGVYGNYDDTPASDSRVSDGEKMVSKAELLYGKNYERMRQVKKQYDHSSLFNNWFPITPASD